MNALTTPWLAGALACAAMADSRVLVAGTLRGELRRDEPMARHTSWRVGGRADRVYIPADLDDLRAFLAALDPREPVYPVGLGSNLLVRDGGVRGTVVFTHGALKRVGLEGPVVYAEAGVPSPKVARFAAIHSLAGAEFLAGIPGTVGGALAMNAGCYGGETWSIVESATTLDRAGVLHERSHDEYDIGYRSVVLKGDATAQRARDPSSLIPHPSDEWFVSARFRLPPGDSAASRRTIKQLLVQRITTQPLSQPNAGSVFRNPAGDYAARLIEACGLKGHALGGASISDKHANFIVNSGNARAGDIEALIEVAHSAVRRKFGIELEREVRIIGAP